MKKSAMLRCLLIVLCASPALSSCVFPAEDGSKPRGLEERSLDAEVVLAAYTRTVHRNSSTSSSGYSAEFLVFNVIKGEDRVSEVYQRRKPSALETALNRRLVNVSNFGDPSRCESDVSPGETYILLLDVLDSGELSARYDGAYGPAVVYSRDKEMALEAIGSSPWGEWSPCSGSCNGGIQQRRRECESGTKCSNDEGQQRTCNMFPCSSILNVLETAGVHRSTLHPSGRPSAYKLLPNGSWRSKEEEIVFPRTFPWEFSLLVTVRLKSSSTGGFLLRVLHSGSLQVGLYISDIITLVLSDKNNIRVSFIKSLFDDHWHQLAFSVRRDTVSFYMNCEYSGKLPLPGKIRPFGGQPATVIVGSTGDHELDAFQGDIEQLTITGSPDAAEKQCNSSTQPINIRGGHYALRQEVRSRPFSTAGTQNDQLPWRGDGVNDEDFTFEDESFQPEDSYDDYDEKSPDKEDSNRENKIPLKEDPSFESDSDEDDDEEDDDEEEDDEEDESDEDEEEEDDEEDESDEDAVDTDEKDDDVAEVPKEDKDQIDNKDADTDDIKDLIGDTDTNITDNKDTFKNESDDEVKKEQGLSEMDYDDMDVAKEDFKVLTEPTTTEEPYESTPKDSYEDSYEDEHVDEEIDDVEDDDDDVEGSGAGYQIKLAWSEWSPCSTTCNWGRRTRTSYCLDNGANLESCAEASAKRSDTEACFLRLCPVTTTHATITTTETTTSTPVTPTFNASRVLSFGKPCRVRCLNGGTCQPPYKCICPPGVYGSLCQYAKQACRVNCKNGGTCLSPSTCVCQKGYFGSECQYAVCKPHCLNGGYCVAPNKCRCKPGYVGNFCHKAVCQHGCKNGGECVAPNKCACRSGFTGKDCSQPYCNPPCQNGGECVKPYFCHCPSGTRGAFCEKHLCNPDCQNGGICVGKGKCSCPRGFSGFHCEQAYCPGGCLNGGQCGKTGKCSCSKGYSGTSCETKKPCKFVEIKEPYKRGYKQKVTTQAKVPCGAWGWKLCTKTKVHYEMVYKTFYKTSYECEGLQKSYPFYQKMKSG